MAKSVAFWLLIAFFVLFLGGLYEWEEGLGLEDKKEDERYDLRDAMRMLLALGLLRSSIPYFITSFKYSKITLQFRSQ